MHRRTFLLSYFAAALLLASAVHAQASERTRGGSAILANDNRRAAGVLHDRTLTLTLRAAIGLWHPEGESGVALQVDAFGESDGPLQIPAPLVRVREGTQITATIVNGLATPLTVHGLCPRDGTACAPIEIAPGSRGGVQFDAGRAGTYHYWASTTGMPLQFRGADDTQLSGAFVVDPAHGEIEPDRVLVLTEWTSLTHEQLRALLAADDIGSAFLALDPKVTFLMNGLSWPATERLRYQLNENVRWRIVNLGTQVHPLHLHGFYFDVESAGDGLKDATVPLDARQPVVTRVLRPGGTIVMTWKAERAGNWLFHCHVSDHVSPDRRLTANVHLHHTAHDASAAMAGMAIGITVVDPSGASKVEDAGRSREPRTLTLLMKEQARRHETGPAYGFALANDPLEEIPVSVPGPTLALRRGEPIEITLVNQLREPTAIHWHGIELESFYDGVHGWSGTGDRVTPTIEPGTSFTVRFTPPRAGTFIYHTHMHDHQLASGMYGAIVVLDEDEAFDPSVDHVVVIGRDGPGRDAPTILNGERDARFSWTAGARHRIRFVNITPNDIFVVSLGGADTPVPWRPVAKDGAPVPKSASSTQPAVATIAVGETYDFMYDAPEGRQVLWMNVRTPAGRWQTQGQVFLHPKP